MITKIFGKKATNDGTIKSKFANFVYCFFVTFYFISVGFLLIGTFFDINFIFLTIFVAFVEAIMIRFLYSFLVKINNLSR